MNQRGCYVICHCMVGCDGRGLEGGIVVFTDWFSIDSVLEDVIAKTRTRELSSDRISSALELPVVAHKALEPDLFQACLIGMMETHLFGWYLWEQLAV